MNGALEDRENKLQDALVEPYLQGLQDYLAGSGENALGRAYDLGRAALAENKSMLELLYIHHAALQRLLQDTRDAEQTAGILRGAGAFLAEVLSPYEMTH